MSEGQQKGAAEIALTEEEKMRLAMALAWDYGADFFYLTDGSGMGFLMPCDNGHDICDGYWFFYTDIWDDSLNSMDEVEAKYGGDWTKYSYFEDCSCKEYEWEDEDDWDDEMREYAAADRQPGLQRDYLGDLAKSFAEALERKGRGLPAVPEPGNDM